LSSTVNVFSVTADSHINNLHALNCHYLQKIDTARKKNIPYADISMQDQYVDKLPIQMHYI